MAWAGCRRRRAGRPSWRRRRPRTWTPWSRRNVCGLSIPVAPGITPGSGPGHLGLFGYDPLRFSIGRGVLEALGIDFDLGPDDVAARGNFCTVGRGRRDHRPPGRPDQHRGLPAPGREAAARSGSTGVELFVEPVRDYRFVLVLRGKGLEAAIDDTDPGREGVPPLSRSRRGRRVGAHRGADRELRRAGQRRSSRTSIPANMVTLRGIARRPPMPSFEEVYRLRAAAIAVYPMYRGLARLVGMTILAAGSNWAEQVEALRQHWADYDFFFLHYKYTDAAGEDGDFERKVKCIEEFDAEIARVMALGPDVLIVTGDHSTPAALRSHSWHPVPVLLAARTCRPDAATAFGEAQCLHGGLGQIEAKYLLPLALAHAGRLAKYGA